MRPFYCFLLLLVGSPAAFATHILGGTIRATQLAGSAYMCQVTVTMYYDALATDVIRAANEVAVCFGDNTIRKINLSRSQPWAQDPKNVVVSEYTTTYAYAGPGVYTVQATLANRSGATNLTGVELPFALKTTLQLVAGRVNQTPVLSLPTTSLRLALNQRNQLNLAAIDPDGDSLSYALAYPLTSVDSETANQCNALTAIPATSYQFPNDVRQIGTYRLDAKTGLLAWDVPTEQGRYMVAITVSEWRAGLLISESRQELTLTVVYQGGTPVTPPPYEPAYVGVLTAVDDRAPDALQLTVSPNPSVGGMVQVSLQNRLGLPAVFSVLDSQGRVHQRIEKSQPLDQQHVQLDLGPQPVGIYFIRAESGGGQVTRKVVKE